jgi:hypothetical protein
METRLYRFNSLFFGLRAVVKEVVSADDQSSENQDASLENQSSEKDVSLEDQVAKLTMRACIKLATSEHRLTAFEAMLLLCAAKPAHINFRRNLQYLLIIECPNTIVKYAHCTNTAL